MQKERGSMIKHAVLAIALLSGSIACADTITFSLIPQDGQVSGVAGSTVGWGYSITNQSANNWLVTTGLNSDSFAFGTPLAIFDFPDLGPGATISLPFDAAAGTGLFQLTWDTSAPADFTNFGHFTLSAEWWNGDPFNGGSFLQTAPATTQAYFATVSENAAIPEPSTIVLELPVLALIIYKLNRVRHLDKRFPAAPRSRFLGSRFGRLFAVLTSRQKGREKRGVAQRTFNETSRLTTLPLRWPRSSSTDASQQRSV
jgi:hypothetical protein